MLVKLVWGCFGLLWLLFGCLVLNVFGGFGGICLVDQLLCACVCLVVLRCFALLLLAGRLWLLGYCICIIVCCFGVLIWYAFVGCFIVVCCLMMLLLAVIFAY